MSYTDFTFDNIHSTEMGVRLLASPISILPPVRDKIITLPGRHGANRANPDIDERILPMQCLLEADSIDDLEEKLAAIRTWLNPINGAKQLIFDRTPDYYFNARWSGSGLNADAIGLGGEFSLEMVCSDPFGYALEPQKIIIEETLYEHDQEGNAPANPLLKLYGISTGSPQKISITIGGKTLTFTGPITVSDVIEIDCDAMTCYKITGTTRVNRLYQLETPDFLVLSPGENTISIDEIGGATFTKLEIDCRNRYL